MKEENNKLVSNCACGCACCGVYSWNFFLRWILGLIILGAVLYLGIWIGNFKAIIANDTAQSAYNLRQNFNHCPTNTAPALPSPVAPL